MTSRSLRIGIDATALWGVKLGVPSGMVNYTTWITESLVEIDSGDSYFVYCINEVPEELAHLERWVRFRTFRVGKARVGYRKLVQQFWLPWVASSRRDRLDVMFFPFNSASLFCPCGSVVTIHDLHPYVVPDRFAVVHGSEMHGSRLRSAVNRAYWKQMLSLSARHADRVLAVSETTRRDIVEILGVPSEKVAVVHEGVDRDRFGPPDPDVDLEKFREEHALPDRYVLCVGTHGYKNLEGSIRAFADVRDLPVAEDLGLVIAGSKSSVTTEIFELVDALGLQEHVHFTGFFPDEQLHRLYQAAEFLLFPSYYEGFGLPVLEAFACGTPVICSTAGALPEVAADAALLVDPGDHEAIAAAAAELLTHSRLKRAMRENGLRRAAQFDWQQAAARTLTILRDNASA